MSRQNTSGRVSGSMKRKLNIDGSDATPLENNVDLSIRRTPASIKNKLPHDQKSQKVLQGVVAFVDYKSDYDDVDTSIRKILIDSGAKVAKTFNRKVTHVVFCDGYRSTYLKALVRKIPLVSAKWMACSRLANKIQDPADYPPVGMDKYTKTPSRNIITPKIRNSPKMFLDPSYMERIRMEQRQFKTRCDDLMAQLDIRK